MAAFPHQRPAGVVSKQILPAVTAPPSRFPGRDRLMDSLWIDAEDALSSIELSIWVGDEIGCERGEEDTT